jgi:lipopolysaccharide export system permease protein
MSFWRASWPMHVAVAVLITLFFLWRLKVNSSWHPSSVWGRIKCQLYRKSKQQCVDHNQMVGN